MLVKEIRNKCEEAFGAENILEGQVLGKSVIVNGLGVVVSPSAEPVNDCRVQIKVERTDGQQ
jgi:hypothetical protein